MGLITRRSWLRRAIAAGVIAVFLPIASTACFGKFQITRNVYNWNNEVSPDKWMRWFVFLVITIIPVYGLATFIDALVVNSIEFWTGENPVKATKRMTGPNGEMLTMELQDDGSIAVLIEHPDGRRDSLRLVREQGAVAAYSAGGRLLARVTGVAGEPAVVEGALAY